ncbi:MAG: DUF2489 domain-containing protein [Cellvibrionaceae bacterium]
MNTSIWLAIAGVVIIVGLAGYAGYLWYEVWYRQRKQNSVETKRNERLAGDIQFLARSLLSAELPMVEGSIRIKVLLDNYSGPRRTDLDLQIFETIYESTAHIPTHQHWTALPKAERDLHMERMEMLEREHKHDVAQAAKQLSKGLGPSE